MTYARGWGLRGALLAAVAGVLTFGAGAAQAQGGAAAGADLRRQLTTLADNPNSIAALADAGRAALDLGDGPAALGFFTRANELSPRDARVKAGLASANVRSGNLQTALMLFDQAVALGAPQGEIAGDRGLAYDLLGHPARAQQDYVASLRFRDDAEIRRRLALSLAISGQRDAALRVIEGQIRSQDRAGLRTRAFVLALSGDGIGASDAARATMPASTATAIVPFLQRMSNLSPVQMASAAHLGRFPNSGGGFRSASAAVADPGALAFAGGSSSPLSSRLPVATASGPRRRPGAAAAEVRRDIRSAEAARAAPARSSTATARPSRTLAASSLPLARPAATPLVQSAFRQPHPHEPLVSPGSITAGVSAAPSLSTNVEAPVELAGMSSTGAPARPTARRQAAPARVAAAAAGEAPPAPVELATALPVMPTELAGGSSAATPQPAERIAAEPAPIVPESAPAATRGIDFARVAATISSLPVEAERPPVQAVSRQTPPGSGPASRPRQTTTRPAAATRNTAAGARSSAAATRPVRTPQQLHPARTWVQIATAARTALPAEYARFRRMAPELLRGRNAYSAPFGGSNSRLLVGPFTSAAEARTFINRLNQEDISSFAWSSTAGQQVDALTAGR